MNIEFSQPKLIFTQDDLKTDIEKLKLKVKENSDAHKRELFIKNDARKKLELEISNLRKLYQEKVCHHDKF